MLTLYRCVGNPGKTLEAGFVLNEHYSGQCVGESLLEMGLGITTNKSLSTTSAKVLKSL